VSGRQTIMRLSQSPTCGLTPFLNSKYIEERPLAGSPFGHSNLIPVRLYRIDRNTFYLFKRRYDHSLVGSAGCAIALTAKPIPAMREVMVRRRRCMCFYLQ
jgi:hypothetical protein